MIRKLASYLKQYKIYAILTPVVMIGEVLMEVLIPFVMADIIDHGIKSGDMRYVALRGLLMVGMSFVSLAFGALGGMFSARAAMGFSKNLREALFAKVQDFSFGNTDRFSTSSLITRLTPDVTHVQIPVLPGILVQVRQAGDDAVVIIGEAYRLRDHGGPDQRPPGDGLFVCHPHPRRRLLSHLLHRSSSFQDHAEKV